jgi:hypothetical protein
VVALSVQQSRQRQHIAAPLNSKGALVSSLVEASEKVSDFARSVILLEMSQRALKEKEASQFYPARLFW